MKKRLLCLLLTGLYYQSLIAQSNPENMAGLNTIKIESHIPGLKLALLHAPAKAKSGKIPVLFIHGSSFPSALAFGFKFNGKSGMDYFADNGFDAFALDFLGYGSADRYPEMQNPTAGGTPPGRANDIYPDIDSAVNYICKYCKCDKVYLVAHSWGGLVASLYTAKFPDKVERLVLFAPLTRRHDAGTAQTITNSYSQMTPTERVDAMLALTPGGETSRLEPQILNDWKAIWLNSDPIAKRFNTNKVRFPAGADQDIENLQHGISPLNPALIKVPVLIIRGEWDAYPSNTDAGLLYSQLTNSPQKKYVVLEKGTHVMHLEKTRTQLYDEILNFLSRSSATNRFNQIAVIFEVTPNAGEKEEYLDIAAKLKPELLKIDGFISIERFQSLTDPGKILSLSFWRDEKAIEQWRNIEMHRDAQKKGRSYIFKDYHLRIADVVRNYGLSDRNEAPADSKLVHTN